MSVEPPKEHNTAIAWTIHVFTSLGIVAGFLGLLSVIDGSPRAALTWFMVAVIIDGLDGPMARHYDISQAIPHIDGNSLDLMIDYVCCVVGPALFLARFHMLPGHRGHVSLIGLVCIGLILVSSLYVMSSKGIMTSDHYFNGFPAMWNLVVTVMFVLQARAWVNVAVTLVLVAFSFIPLKFIHPIRVRDFRKITIPILVVWLGAMLYITWIINGRTSQIGCERHCLNGSAEWVQGVVWLGSVWIIGVGVLRTFRGPSSPSGSGESSSDAAELVPSTGDAPLGHDPRFQ